MPQRNSAYPRDGIFTHRRCLHRRRRQMWILLIYAINFTNLRYLRGKNPLFFSSLCNGFSCDDVATMPARRKRAASTPSNAEEATSFPKATGSWRRRPINADCRLQSAIDA